MLCLFPSFLSLFIVFLFIEDVFSFSGTDFRKATRSRAGFLIRICLEESSNMTVSPGLISN